MKLLVTVAPMDAFPKGYGLAYRRWNSFLVVTAPVPLNLVIGAVWAFYQLLRDGPYHIESRRFRMLHRAYSHGYHEGFGKGKIEGEAYFFKMRDRQVLEANVRIAVLEETIGRMCQILAGRPDHVT